MAQINFYVPDELEIKIKNAAKKSGLNLSVFLSDIIKKQIGGAQEWPKGFFSNVLGQWQGDFPQIDDPLPQEREWD